MANPSKKKKTEKTEVVAYFDHESINIENLICTIRGQKVMVDFDLAMLYGVQNKRLNEQVKRNKERFPNDFMFQLTHEEWNVLRSQFAATKTPEYQTIALLRSQFATTKDLSKIRTLPYVFTRNGIGMLSSVLGSETAVAMNIRIMRAFTASHQIMEIQPAIRLWKATPFCSNEYSIWNSTNRRRMRKSIILLPKWTIYRPSF